MPKTDKELTVELVSSYIKASGENGNAKIMNNLQYAEFIETIFQVVCNLTEKERN